MSELLEKRIKEWAEFYHNNKDRIPPNSVQKRCEFMELMLDGAVEMLAIAAKDIQILERRNQISRDKPPMLLLPPGFSIHNYRGR